MTTWQLEEEVGQACFLLKSHAVTLSFMTMKVKHVKNAVHFTSKHQQADLWSHVADRLIEANAQAPAVAVYLL